MGVVFDMKKSVRIGTGAIVAGFIMFGGAATAQAGLMEDALNCIQSGDYDKNLDTEEYIAACTSVIEAGGPGLQAEGVIGNPDLVPTYMQRFHYFRGTHYKDNENWADALDDLNESINLDDAHADSYFQRAWVHHHLGNGAEAKADYKKAAELDPGDDNYKKFAKEYDY